MSAFSSACSCLCEAAVACPEQRYRTTASALGEIDRLAADAAEAFGAGEDAYIAVPGLCLCLSGRPPGKVARLAVSGLRLCPEAELFAHSVISALEFS